MELESLVLENEWIRLLCYPSIGGKIASILFKPLSQELLWQSQEGYRIPSYGASFSAYDKSGIDECFPMIDTEQIWWEGKNIQLPDHGELWCQAWDMHLVDKVLVGKILGQVWKYSFERKISLKNKTLRFEYQIQNHESFAIPGFWTFHPLFAISESAWFEWPGCTEIELAHPDLELGKKGIRLPFPTGPHSENLQQIRPYSNSTRKFFHAGKYASGQAFLHLPELSIGMKWDPYQIPYVGAWINEGGYEKAYNMAIEPSTGYYDTIQLALENQSIHPIQPKETRSFWLEMEIKEKVDSTPLDVR